jgi:hypothetical protein
MHTHFIDSVNAEQSVQVPDRINPVDTQPPGVEYKFIDLRGSAANRGPATGNYGWSGLP